MVQDADEQDHLSWCLVAHTMSSLERTLLAQVKQQPTLVQQKHSELQ